MSVLSRIRTAALSAIRSTLRIMPNRALPERPAGQLPNAGLRAGFIDPNTENTPQFLYGTSSTLGYLDGALRTADDTIAPAMNARYEMLQALDYYVRPQDRYKDDPDAIILARMVESVLRDLTTHRELGQLVADVYDATYTCGASLWQMTQTDGRLGLSKVRLGYLLNWEQDPETNGNTWRRVQVLSASGATWLDNDVFGDNPAAYFALRPEPGHYYGNSALRSLVAASTTTDALYKALLQALYYQRGGIYAKGTGNGVMTQADWQNLQTFFADMMRGETSAVILSAAVDLHAVNVQAGAMQNFAPLAQAQTERKNAATLNALNNLGIQREGSRALAEVISDASNALIRSHLNGAMDMISGQRPEWGTLIPNIVRLLGGDERKAPVIAINWSDASVRLSREHLQTVAELLDRRTLTRTPDTVGWLAEQAGMPAEVVAQQKAAAQAELAGRGTAETVPVGTLTAIAQIAADPAVSADTLAAIAEAANVPAPIIEKLKAAKAAQTAPAPAPAPAPAQEAP